MLISSNVSLKVIMLCVVITTFIDKTQLTKKFGNSKPKADFQTLVLCLNKSSLIYPKSIFIFGGKLILFNSAINFKSFLYSKWKSLL